MEPLTWVGVVMTAITTAGTCFGMYVTSRLSTLKEQIVTLKAQDEKCEKDAAEMRTTQIRLQLQLAECERKHQAAAVLHTSDDQRIVALEQKTQPAG